MSRVAVVGSREFPRLEAVREYIRTLPTDTVILSGGARGVDRVAVDEAKQRGMPYEEYLADWLQYGKRAGRLRNKILVERADAVVAFWDGTSRGTKHAIDLARAAHKAVEIIGP